MGKLIVIEGGDGSGKSTQFALLKERLTKEKIKFWSTKFPRHHHPSAYFVEKMLHGDYGSLEEQNPYRTSLFYMLDRYDAAAEIRAHLEQGDLVILDRYTSANVGHQASKIMDPIERKRFISWLWEMEYGICELPKPDKIFYLHMPHMLAFDLLQKRTDTKHDIHETNLDYLKNVEDAFLDAAALFPEWEKISCTTSGCLRSIEEIHEVLFTKISLLCRE